MNKKIDQKNLIDVYQAILLLDDINEVKRFFRDLLTREELEEVSKRWKAAQMLDQGVPYVEIEKETGLSSTTVARVSKWLKGGKGGYRKVISKLHGDPSLTKKGLI
jgi:TrpR-related protein YerC/YecD